MDFTAIYEEFHPKIVRYLRHLTREDEAADLTQTVFLKVSSSLPNFRGDSSVATWVYRIATNVAKDHALSSLKKWKEAEIPLEDAGCIERFTDTGPEPDAEYVRQEMNACIRSIVDQLPGPYRTVLLLADFEELKNKEVAEILGVTLETVKIRLHRARSAMRKALECQCTFYHDGRNELMCDRQ